jgi:TP901 family phage tail tape measure protein
MAGNYTRRIYLYINGKEVKNDIASIRAEMNKLVNEQSRLTRGTKEYVDAGKKIRVLKGILQEHNAQVQATEKSWSFAGISHAMNRHYLAIMSLVAAIGGLLMAGKKAISMFAEFDDKVSDVRKTTGLTKDQVYELNESLKKLNTRTAQNDLLDLGRIAGKLGIHAKEDIEGFIKASDKVVVALREDLGNNAEEAVRQIGKLVSIFGLKERFGIENAILKTGSAINELGMASTANEAYIVQFTKRVAGIAPSANISIQDVLGLAATLDHLGQTCEVSSTAYSQVVTGMFKNTPEFAKAAGMSVEKFSALLKRDANEAFLKLLEGLHNNSSGMEALVKSLGSLDMEGKRAISVIGVLSNNTKLLREQQKLSNREFAVGTSLQQEFNVKNNNAQAILEKKRKILNNLAVDLGGKLLPVLTVSTSGFSYFVKSVSVLTDFVIRNSAAIINLTAAIAAYTIASKISTLWQNRASQATLAQIIATKARVMAEGASIAVTQLYAAATMLLTGNVKGATQAFRVFSSVVKANPVGLLIGVLTLAAGALVTFWNRTEEVVSQGISLTTEIIRLQKEKIDHVVKEKNELNGLVSQLMLTNENSALRKDLIKQLQTLYPDFLKNLNAEKVTNQQLAGQLGIVNAKYREKAKLAALSAKSEALTLKMTDNESKIIEAQESLKTQRNKKLDPRSPEGMKMQENISLVSRLTRENESYMAVLDKLDKKIVDLKKQNDDNSLEWWTSKIVELTWAIQNTKRLMREAQQENNYLGYQNLSLELEDYNRQLQTASETLSLLQKTKPAKGKGKKDPDTPLFLDDSTAKPPKWSLNSDADFLKASLKLKQDYGKGIIKTEEEFENSMRSLEINTLSKRIRSNKESGEELLAIRQQLADKYIEIRKKQDKREDALDDAAKTGLSPLDRQIQDFKDKLTDLGLAGKSLRDMSSKEMQAYTALEKEHLEKLSRLDADAMKDEIDRRQRSFETGLADVRLRNSEELNSITSLAQAKKILSETMSNEELQKIRSLDKAKKLIQKQQAIEEEQFAREHLEELLQILQGVMETGEWESIDLSDSLLSDEEKQLLIDRINEIKKSLSGLTAGEDETDPVLNKIGGMSTDVLGFSPQDWDLLFENLKEGKLKVEDMIMAAKALTKIFESYYDSVSKGEESRYKQYESNINGQKKTLQQNLDNNLISQQAYNFQMAQLDRELEGRKAQMERRNAIRARNVAIMEAIVNTASAVTSALKVAPPLGLILAGIVGGLGAFQIGKIIGTPLPTIEGKEDGGFLDVKRAQDGKFFRAKKDPGKRGYVSTPTVITGEKAGSSEYIVSDAGVSNPTVRPILDILEMARLNGNLSTINLPAILESTQTYPGRQSGGYVSDITKIAPGGNQSPAAPAQDPALLEIIRQNTIIMASLKARLDKGIESKVALHGRGGLYDVMEEDAQLKRNANF